MLTPVLQSALQHYDKLSLASPILAKSIVSCTTYATAEYVRQGIMSTVSQDDANTCVSYNGDDAAIATEDKSASVGFRRGLLGIMFMACVGALIHAPWINFWFGLLENFRPGKTSMDIASKVVLDQLVGSPIYFIIIMSVTGIADGYSRQANVRRIREGIWPAMKLSWMAWPALHVVNFSLVPLQRRALLLQFGGLLWAIFLCYCTAQKTTAE